jgi:hypothetical protein
MSIAPSVIMVTRTHSQSQTPPNFSQTLEFKGFLELSVGWPKSNVFGQMALTTFLVRLLREAQGLCRLWSVPAGGWSFPTLSL